MAVARTAAAALNLVNALWAIYISLVAINTPTGCPSGGCPSDLLSSLPTALLGVAVILIIDCILCFLGLRLGFVTGAFLSLIIVGLIVVRWTDYGVLGSSVALVLSACALVLDILSLRSRMRIPEESHPLNLPVFG